MNSLLPFPEAVGSRASSQRDPEPAGGFGSALGETHYDVVIAGASFAGLAVALSLRGCRVVLVDRAPLGEGVTSACAAPVSTVCALHAEASVLQIHDYLVMHTLASRAVWPLSEPFCTFDYRQLCRAAFAATGAEFVQAHVVGRRGRIAQTSSGELMGDVLVDATGWRAVLAGGSAPTDRNRRRLAFGIESEVEFTLDAGLHFYFLPEVCDGYAWAFPAGDRVRFGALSYRGRSKLGESLEKFMARFGLKPGPIHGGFLPSGLREPVVDGVFVVGDASGHCLPLTGEGIRTAVLGGYQCGDLIQQVLGGQVSSADAADRYRDFANRSHRKFRALQWGTSALLRLPLSVVRQVVEWLSRPRLLRMFMRWYLTIFLEPLHERSFPMTSLPNHQASTRTPDAEA